MQNKRMIYGVALIHPDDEGEGPITIYPCKNAELAKEFYEELLVSNRFDDCWLIGPENMMRILIDNVWEGVPSQH